MSGVFRNIDPPNPLTARRVCTPPPPRHWCGRKTHPLGREGVGVNSSEDATHCSVLYKYVSTLCCGLYFVCGILLDAIGLAFHWLLRQKVKLKANRIFIELMLSGRRNEIKLRLCPLR
jgi:hypothetical protein